VLRDGEVLLNELELSSLEIGQLGEVVARQAINDHFSTDALGHFIEQSPEFRRQASGVLYRRLHTLHVPHSLELLWLRREEATQVDWAGRPEKLRREVDGQVRISPRRSFEKWSEQRLGQSRAWRSTDEMMVSKLAVGALSVLRQGG
jgi:light-regulated signal transduction histidine kinase (bacteriophytochrome)